MTKLYFMLGSKINAMIAETVIPGSHIYLDGYIYEQLSRAPRGKRILRKLINEEKQERILIYN